MLVITRYRDQSVVIDNKAEIVIVDIRGNKVRLGITAPKEISVHRKEVQEAINRKKESLLMPVASD